MNDTNPQGNGNLHAGPSQLTPLVRSSQHRYTSEKLVDLKSVINWDDCLFHIISSGKRGSNQPPETFGCLGFTGVPEEQQRLFTSKTSCLLMGYGPNSTSIYKVMDVETKRVFHIPTVNL